ncbi:probable selenium-dependent hydroxylase accessory protein YqeC [Halopelagius inordinatus]|uniref:Probable selenium-dependent hydroxylase accessory protein YqeC n=1 Tax=Halopelagius inordinatus TaxID=553467 RepID=A0A1I2N7G9_9EURY|nr:selenium cofactor biosynthesis protein YqeC [Halopelagius inordinatus]SFF97687.1 probable selenium-dependent hydroxylase accessory protein YqeC [Halopelagius inordinatus]
MTSNTLSRTLGVDEESVVSVVGAGGKKTTLYRLAGETDGVVTATVRIPIFDDEVARVVVTEDPRRAARAETRRPLGLVPEREREDRYFGYDPDIVDELAGSGIGPLLVKADGARNRLFKAPDDREPQIPRASTHVLALASARVVGEPLAERAVHRPDRVSELTGLSAGEEIRPSHVATVLAHERGGLKAVPDGADAVPTVNMVDTSELADVGREIARGVLDRTSAVDRVLLTKMTASDPVVEVVER